MIDLTHLFSSQTVKPSYRASHVLAGLFLLADHPRGVGRYRLGEALGLGEGSAKSMFRKLGDAGLIRRASTDARRSGSVLSEEGAALVEDLRRAIPFLVEGPDFLCEHGEKLCLAPACFVAGAKRAAKGVSGWVDVRDAALKVGGTGATALVVSSRSIRFPDHERALPGDYEESRAFLVELVERHGLVEGDVLVLGGGPAGPVARVATVEATLALLPKLVAW
ncbi:MAG: hypothetical protein Kow0069_00560 [Promethearchaeota archaeon]